MSQSPAARERLPRFFAAAGRLVVDPLALAELFLLANISFLGVDVYVAHSVNGFASPAEWVPVAFSAAATVLLAAAMFLAGDVRPPLGPGAADSRRPLLAAMFLAGDVRPPLGHRAAGTRRQIAWALGLAVGGLSVGVGIAGLILHLESGFFQRQTIANLVYAAPFAAPLAYAGLGLLAILNRLVPAESEGWARWVVFLALGGFVGNFVLSLTDHAQNGFFDPREWIAVAAAAFAVGALLAAVVDYRNRPFLVLCLLVMAAEIVVGLLGWYYHLSAILRSPMAGLWAKILYSAPVFAPLLFANLAVLGLLGLWGLLRQPGAHARGAERRED